MEQKQIPLKVGHLVELHPGTDQWMMGDRFGSVTRIKDGVVFVKMDRSRKTLKCRLDHISPPKSQEFEAKVWVLP